MPTLTCWTQEEEETAKEAEEEQRITTEANWKNAVSRKARECFKMEGS